MKIYMKLFSETFLYLHSLLYYLPPDMLDAMAYVTVFGHYSMS